MTTNKKKPAHQIRIGRIAAAIWGNHSEKNGDWFSVTISRLYMQDEGEWKRSESFSGEDLLVLAKVADLSFEWIHEQATLTAEPDHDEPEEQPNI
jgi:hypothetical protein